MSAAAFCTIGQWFQFGIADRSTDRLIGDIGVCVHGPEKGHAELGFTLAADWQGRGLAFEAVCETLVLLFENTDIDRVIAITDARNDASVRLLERVGMKRLETLNAVFRGEPCLEHVLSIHRQECAAARHRVES
jgi:RimJ/RimL family protein N-acetyltransferase